MVSSGRVPSFDLLLLGVAIVAISTSAPLIAGAAAPTLAIAFWRNALALPVLGAWVLGRAPERAAWRGRTRDEKRLTGLAGLLLGAHFALWVPKSGSASWRERVCQYVEIAVVAVELKKKRTTEQE